MIPNRNQLDWFLCSCVLLAGACESPGPTGVNYGVTRVARAEDDAVFEAAEAVLIDLGYALDRREPASGLLTTQPIEFNERKDFSRGGSRLSSEGRMRRVAEVRISAGDEEVQVFCKVVVQEQTSQAHRVFAHHYEASDLPRETAIERDAATTTRQNAVWQTRRRDRTAEREILAAIEERSEFPTERGVNGLGDEAANEP